MRKFRIKAGIFWVVFGVFIGLQSFLVGMTEETIWRKLAAEKIALLASEFDDPSDVSIRIRTINLRYKNYERDVQSQKFEKIKSSNWINFSGGIHYGMTLDKIKEALTEKFKSMKHVIISKENFAKIENNYFLRPSTDFSRLLGVEYLQRKITENKTLSEFAVPGYVIVADDPKSITINLNIDNARLPIVRLSKAKIYFEKIEGSDYAQSLKNDLRCKLTAYTDFNDFGGNDNIIHGYGLLSQSRETKYYIVDTELKSFNFYFDLPYDVVSFIKYLHERFMYFNKDNLPSEIKISLEN